MVRSSVSSIDRFVEGFGDLAFFMGVDVHKRSYSVALLRPDGVVHDWRMPADPLALTARLAALPIRIGTVCYEAGPTGFGLARHLGRAGIRVLVAAPSRIPRPVAATNKTDSLDCIKLAEFAASGLLRGIAVPSKQEEAFRALCRRRHQLTDSLRKAKQRIRALLLTLGVAEPPGIDNWSAAALSALRQLRLEAGAMDTLHSLLRELDFHVGEQRKVDARLRDIAKERDEYRRIDAMRSVPGVGPVVATTFAAEVFRPRRFNRAQEVTAYLGLAPVVRHSGEKTPKGRLRPVGQRRLRSLLVEAAWVWKQRDERAREFYNRILGRTGLPQKAISALARKLAAHLWRLSLPQTAA
jgi:transposase